MRFERIVRHSNVTPSTGDGEREISNLIHLQQAVEYAIIACVNIPHVPINVLRHTEDTIFIGM